MSDTTEPTAAPRTPATSTSTSAPTAAAEPTPLQMLKLPGLPQAGNDIPVCGPAGCAVPVRGKP